ncbi:caspase recruitment domain-containing protein 8 isoform X2 [Eumetopias jubatus]|uniref:caspase recruitment domain-containing protein 8 isoform X2 n=1 Tax=Eumetopias jubatus TaxID=34886 RepID=UPI0010169438|nr:caspase recruitment domain-containing protein 8 isoform X2 [Eumetopias jubatus]
MSGARRKFTCFADTRCFQGGYSEVGDKSVYRRIRMLDKDFQLCPSSECEKEITVEPAPYIPAAGPQSCEEAFSRAPVRSESDQESSQTQESEEICLEEKTLVPLQAPKLFSGVEPACKSNQFLGPEGNVDIELMDKNANRYSVHFPTAGFYLWPATHLGFSVTAAVTVRIAFDSWGQHLDLKLQHEEQWMVAGPLFEVPVEPEGVITEIHLPHIISLPANEVDISWFRVAHFKDEGMVLEPPARVKPFCAVLENPSFSLMGILLRIASGSSVSVPITSTVLIYYHFHPEDSKFHLYLIPSDSLLMKAIDDEEAKFHGVRLQTSPPVDPLNFGSRYIVSSSPHLEIMPKELKLSYRSPGEIQVFSKVYAGKMEEPIVLKVTNKRHKTLVWHTWVKPVDLKFHATLVPPPFSGVAFMKEYRRQLQARLGDLNGVLDDLQDSEVFTEEEKELVQRLPTQRRKNETLLTMVEKKGPQALEILFRSLNQRDPYLMSYLSQQSLQ